MIMTLDQIIKAIADKWFHTVKCELVRYGQILDCTDTNRKDGAHRLYIIKHHNRVFDIKMHNGKTSDIKIRPE